MHFYKECGDDNFNSYFLAKKVKKSHAEAMLVFCNDDGIISPFIINTNILIYFSDLSYFSLKLHILKKSDYVDKFLKLSSIALALGTLRVPICV